MKLYRLLVAWPVIEQLNALPAGPRKRLGQKLLMLEDTPDSLSEFQEKDESGRLLDAFIFDNRAIFYWIDFADRHVKVLHMEPADHTRRN